MDGFSAMASLGRLLLDLWISPQGNAVVASFLATIFAVSGVIKLRHPALTAMAIVDFGVVRRVRPSLGLALGVVELSLAASLPILPRFAGAAATGLLLAFAILIGRSLVRSHDFACFCFGSSDDELSWRTLVRTAALTVFAAVLALTVPMTSPIGLSLLTEATVAVGLLGLLALGGQIPRLLHWNSGVFSAH